MPLKEYEPGTAFPGTIGRTVDESAPAWPKRAGAKKDAPNVLFIVLDDTGFGQIGCYGSPIRTPNIDRLAANGLLYSNMHTTALCSPTRTCILTGRNHHSNGMACIVEMATGFPGYNATIPFENGFLSEMLLNAGYNTYAVGKWHLAPAQQLSAAGPFDRWPLGRGFERYYGFLGGDTSQYYPDLVADNHRISVPGTPEEGYHLTEDLADQTMRFIADAKQVAPDKPFFTYFCTGAMHAPHQVPQVWIDKNKGAFDAGWEVYRQQTFARQKTLGIIPADTELPAHDPDVQRWASLTADEKRLYSRMMEVYAGFLEHTDHQIGRVLSFLERMGELDNTLVMFISDNGASAEGGLHGSVNENLFFNNVPESLEVNLKAIDELGGPKHYNHYPWGWTWAGNTPFRRWKRETYRGGVADPFIVHWPNGIKARGEIRTQFLHAIDMVPTVLDALGLTAPTQLRGVTQSPIHGTSFRDSFADANAPSNHVTQYFEMMGHRSIYHDGWKAVCPVPGPSFAEAGVGFGEMEITDEKLRELDLNGWELFHVADDYSESTNVAEEHPDKLRELIAIWYVEAGKYQVLPLDSRGAERLAEERPTIGEAREHYVFYPGTSTVPRTVAPKTLNRPHSITATVDIEKGTEGVLLAQGGNSGGFTFFVRDEKLHYVYNYMGLDEFSVESTGTIPEGRRQLRVEFDPTDAPDVASGRGAPGTAQLYVDGKLVGEAQIPKTAPFAIDISEGLDCGRDDGSTVTASYSPPFEFSGGTLHEVAVDVSGDLFEDRKAEMQIFMSQQ